jgi:CheY-like chemotaxis protein
MMPGMNGVEVLQRILTLHATLPVIIATARADAARAEQTRAVGALAYVTKPFEVADLARVVDGALARSGEDSRGPARL